jgi:hypothetical protein
MSSACKSGCCRLLPLTVLLLAGCLGQVFNSRFTAQEEISESFATGPAPRIIVEMFNGGIDVTAGAADKVGADVTRRCGGETQEAANENLALVEIELLQEGDTVRITARQAKGAVLHNAGASAKVQVPPGASLELRSGNGKVTVQGVAGKTTVQTSNGGIQVKDGKGPLGLTTSNGSITVQGATGPMGLTTNNGGIEVDAENAVVTARTSNGKIRFSGTLADGEQSFKSSNGGITLTLPAGARFQLDAKTSNGRISSAFAVQSSGGSKKNHLRGTVGDDPATSIKLDTSNANIDLRKGR